MASPESNTSTSNLPLKGDEQSSMLTSNKLLEAPLDRISPDFLASSCSKMASNNEETSSSMEPRYSPSPFSSHSPVVDMMSIGSSLTLPLNKNKFSNRLQKSQTISAADAHMKLTLKCYNVLEPGSLPVTASSSPADPTILAPLLNARMVDSSIVEKRLLRSISHQGTNPYEFDSAGIYSSDSYLQKKGSIRKGFGGNYRRSIDDSSGMAAVPLVHTIERRSRGGQTIVENCSKTNKTVGIVLNNKSESGKVYETSAEKQAKQLVVENLLKKDMKLFVYTEGKLNGHLPAVPEHNNNQMPGKSDRNPVNQDETEPPAISVRECIRSFENLTLRRTSSPLQNSSNSCIKQVGDARTAFVSRSNTQITDACGCSKSKRLSWPKGSLSLDHLNGQNKDEYVQNQGQVQETPGMEFNRRQSLESHQSSSCKTARNFVLSKISRDSREKKSDIARQFKSSDSRKTCNELTSLLLNKADSSDSGIDTKIDSVTNRSADESLSSPEVKESVSYINGPSSNLVNVETSKFESVKVLIENESSSISNAESSVGNISVSSASNEWTFRSCVNYEQINRQELEYNKLATIFLRRIVEIEKRNRFSVLLPACHTFTSYLKDCFQNFIPALTVCGSPEDEVTDDLSEIQDNDLMDKLTTCIKDEIDLLNKAKLMIENENEERLEMKSKISSLVKNKLDGKQFEKFHLYIDELDKMMHLLLLLSDRLVRTESQIAKLTSAADSNPAFHTTLAAKRGDLLQKLEDAKSLKDGIDRRSVAVNECLKSCLTAADYQNYEHMIRNTFRLRLGLQWINEHLNLAKERLALLELEQSGDNSTSK